MTPRRMAQAALLVALYVVVGQLVQFIPNPMVPGAIIALNMIVIVVAGILFGPVAGGLVGLLGTGVNGFLTPAGGAFERAAIMPHLFMGVTAGLLGRRSLFAGALSVLVGHALNILMFVVIGLLPLAAVAGAVMIKEAML